MSVNIAVLVTLIIMTLSSVVSTFVRDINIERQLYKQGENPLPGSHYVNLIMVGVSTIIGYFIGLLVINSFLTELPILSFYIQIIIIYYVLGLVFRYIYISIVALVKYFKQGKA